MSVITGNTSLVTMLQNYPQTTVVLDKYRLGCMSCHGIKHETVARVAIAHGLDLNALLLDLNAVL